MVLTAEQKQTVATWVAGGDNLSTIQRKLRDELKVSLTYMDVRFLVDDLNLQLKDPPAEGRHRPLSKAAPARRKRPGEKKGFLDKAKEKLGLGERSGLAEDDLPDEGEDLGVDPAGGLGGPGGVTVVVDKVTLIPGAIASGSVTFGDGVTGKWIVDNYGRPGFTEVSRPDYRPSPADAQAFMQELSAALHKRGLVETEALGAARPMLTHLAYAEKSNPRNGTGGNTRRGRSRTANCGSTASAFISASASWPAACSCSPTPPPAILSTCLSAPTIPGSSRPCCCTTSSWRISSAACS